MIGAALVLVGSIAAIKYEVNVQDRVRSEEIARSTAARLSGAVQSVFADAFASVKTAREGMMALQDNGLTDPRAYDTMLKELIASSGQAYGAWLVWDEPDAPLDETGSSRRDTQGRFATYWHQNGMEMLRDSMPAEILARLSRASRRMIRRATCRATWRVIWQFTRRTILLATGPVTARRRSRR
jgi:hypothetical protein